METFVRFAIAHRAYALPAAPICNLGSITSFSDYPRHFACPDSDQIADVRGCRLRADFVAEVGDWTREAAASIS